MIIKKLLLVMNGGKYMLFIEYPKCSTCQKAKKWLDAHNISYNIDKSEVCAIICITIM